MDPLNKNLWRVATFYRRTASDNAYYRWHVEGVNAETGDSFSWSVPDLNDPGFDLSSATEIADPFAK